MESGEREREGGRNESQSDSINEKLSWKKNRNMGKLDISITVGGEIAEKFMAGE